MAWPEYITWMLVRASDDISVSFESKTESDTRYVWLSDGSKQVEQPYDILSRRAVYTRTRVLEYESEAPTTVQTVDASTATGNADTQEYTTTSYSASRANASGGYTHVKRVTTVAVTYGQWKEISRTYQDVEA